MIEQIRMSPTPLRATKQAISKFAEEVAVRLGYYPAASMHEIVSKLKGRISYKPEVSPESGIPESIVVQPSGEFQIFLPTITSNERDRFTIAHELGHFFLHYPLIRKQNPNAIMYATRWVDEMNEGQKRAEWEANWFAAAFVMPEAAFKSVYHNGLAYAAAHFGVSQAAAKVRAQSLNV